MGALAGAGSGGVVGGLIGALVGMGIPEYEAKRYEGMVKHGGILLSVHCDNSDWVKRAKDILEQTGAHCGIFEWRGQRGLRRERQTARPSRRRRHHL